MSIFNAGEIVDLAVKIEENGLNFYRSFADTLDSEKAKNVFNLLADEESKHRETFSKMLQSVEKFEPPTSYPDEYFAYLQAYADSVIFTPDDLKRKVESISSSRDAIEFGIRRELDSILYYQEMKSFVPESQKETVDKIIAEERNHFLKLSSMKKEM
jgi:rubrerythrin